MKIYKPDELKEKSIKELYSELDSSEKGLDEKEVSRRTNEYGPNEIVEKKAHPLIKFLKNFWAPIPWMIEIAAIISAVIHHWEDFFIILSLLMLNALVSFWQEHKADNAIEMLKKKLALNARVLRDNKWNQVKANVLVPGDVIRVRLGDVIPADIKLISGDFLNVDESALTGESLPVEKDLGDLAYSGSVVRQGEMNGLVVATGMNTFFGRTAKLVEQGGTRSHFQKAVIKIGNYLIVFALALVVVILTVGLIRHEGFMEMFQFALVLMVAAIPAALPAVLSVTMAVGASALAQKQAIVSKLASIEEMAGMDILCSDKTGTITKNELTVAEVVPFGSFSADQVLLYASLASNPDDEDVIDNAILEKTKQQKELWEKAETFKTQHFTPFDPVSKRTEAVLQDPESQQIKVAKGAPQMILKLTGEANHSSDEVDNHIEEFAEKGYRALGVATADKEDHWKYVGLIPLYDPPREDSAQTIEQAQQMGVSVKMVTGDHKSIAQQIAGEVGMGKEIMIADELESESSAEIAARVEKVNGFAQVFPEHKYKIVEALQEKGHIVGMTGDGVNDAPALKRSDAGIAVAGATDAAKSAAAIVLTKPGLSVIIDAIRQSRKIFQRMGNYSIYRIAETIRVILFITVSILTFQFYPVTALMIVLLALLNDAPIMTIAFDNVKVSPTPDKWKMRSTLEVATVLGVIGVISSFGIFFIGKEVLHLDKEILQSFIYLKLSLAGQLTVFVARTRGHFWSVKPALPLLVAVIATQTVATLIVVYGFLLPAMGWKLAGMVWGYALVAFLITDFLKVWFYKLMDHRRTKIA
ncbi:MAG: plasma-membrane proton-efflux P-type ATPase [Bacteroidales bacterium]